MRTECGGLIERNDLCLVEVLAYRWQPGRSCRILGLFADAGISLCYLTIGNGADGLRNLSLCVARQHYDGTVKLLDEIRAVHQPKAIDVREPVAILTLYGPHFYERIALASEVYHALCRDGIDTLSLGSSVNSISAVVAEPDAPAAKASFRKSFSWPE
jgi:aspartokinase